jgi:hypothetical protein
MYNNDMVFNLCTSPISKGDFAIFNIIKSQYEKGNK